MYKRDTKKLTNNMKDLSGYIEGSDVYNSIIVDLFFVSFYERVPYEIRTFEFRPDLLAKDIYGDEKYMGIFILTCGVGLEGLYKGAVISVFPKSVIDEIILKLHR